MLSLSRWKQPFRNSQHLDVLQRCSLHIVLRKRRGHETALSSAIRRGSAERERSKYEATGGQTHRPAHRGRRTQTDTAKTPGRDAPAASPKTSRGSLHRDPLEPRGEGSPRDPLERMGAAQSSRDEIRRNLKLEFILAQARGLEGEALFDHMAAVTEAKIVGRSRPPSQMSQKSRTPRSRVSSRGSRPGTGRSSSIGSRPGTGQTVRFAKPFNGVTYGGFAIPTARRSHTPKHLASSPATTGARTGRTAASRASGPATEGGLAEAAAPGPQGARARRPTSRTSRRTGSRSSRPSPLLKRNGSLPCAVRRPRSKLRGRAPTRVWTRDRVDEGKRWNAVGRRLGIAA